MSSSRSYVVVVLSKFNTIKSDHGPLDFEKAERLAHGKETESGDFVTVKELESPVA